MLVLLLASDSEQSIQQTEMTVLVIVVVVLCCACLLVFVLLETLGWKELRPERKNLQVIPMRMFMKSWDSGEIAKVHLGGVEEKDYY